MQQHGKFGYIFLFNVLICCDGNIKSLQSPKLGSKHAFNQMINDYEKQAATGNETHSRPKRAVLCSDRPKHACVNGIPQDWTRISQTDGRRFTDGCDLNDFQKNPQWIKDLIQDDNFRLSYKLGSQQKLKIYGWWSVHRKRGSKGPRPGEELTYCPGSGMSIFHAREIRAFTNARIKNRCVNPNVKCDPIDDTNKCGNTQQARMDYYIYHGKYNKRNEKFKMGKVWLKCRNPPGPNGHIVAQVVCDYKGQIQIQINYGNYTGTGVYLKNEMWYDVRLMHSPTRKGKNWEPDEKTWPYYGYDDRIKSWCIGTHCYDRFSINTTISDAKTQFQQLDELCKLKEKPFEKCMAGGVSINQGQLPPTPSGATSVECKKLRCWPVCKKDLLLEYPQRFKCDVTGFDSATGSDIYGWHIDPGYKGLSKCIGCTPLLSLISSTVNVTVSTQKKGLAGYEIFCDPDAWNTLKFDWTIDPSLGNRRQKEYIKTERKRKHLFCKCEIKPDKNKNQRRKCQWYFSNASTIFSSDPDSWKGRKFPVQDLKKIECHNSAYKPWNRLTNMKVGK